MRVPQAVHFLKTYTDFENNMIELNHCSEKDDNLGNKCCVNKRWNYYSTVGGLTANALHLGSYNCMQKENVNAQEMLMINQGQGQPS